MFTSINLKNVRSFRRTGEVPLRPLTVIVGPNNTGKSTLLNSILLLKQTLEDPTYDQALITAGVVDMGGFEDILRGGRDADEKTFSIALSIAPTLADSAEWNPVRATSEKKPSATTLSATFSFDPDAERIRLASGRFTRGRRTLLEVGWLRDQDSIAVFAPTRFKRFTASPNSFIPNIELKRSDFTSDNNADWRLLQEANESHLRVFQWHELIRAVEHISPVRRSIPRMTLVGRTSSADIGVGGDELITLLKAKEGPRLGGQRRLIDVVEEWMTERFSMLGALRTSQIDRAGQVLALLADERHGYTGINVANMGEGISQLLPVVASVVLTPPGGCLLVEQPEIHLHPAAQCDLGDLFAASVTDEDGPQFIVETHSEHLLLRVRRRIAEGKLDPGHVSVLYVDKPGRQATIKSLELDPRGHFIEWPKGFFAEGYDEAMNLAEASSR